MLISRTIDNIGNEMAAQVLNDSCLRQRDKDAKKMDLMWRVRAQLVER